MPALPPSSVSPSFATAQALENYDVNVPLGESLFKGLNPYSIGDVKEAKDRINAFTLQQGYSNDQMDAMGHAGVASWASPTLNLGTEIRDKAQGIVGGFSEDWQPLSNVPVLSSIPPVNLQSSASWFWGVPEGNAPEEVTKDLFNTGWGGENRDISFSDLLEQAAPGGDLIIRGPYDEALPIDTSVPLTDEINFSGPVQDAAREDWNRRDQMAQWYERAFIDPDEYGWTRPTIEQRQEAIRGVQDAPKGFWGALQDRIANLIPGAEASVARDVEFEREQREPTWFPPTTSSGSAMVTEPIPTVEPSPFIVPSFAEGGYTIAPSGPAVGDEEEEVSEERVVEIKKKPKEKRTSVEEQVVVASEVKKALDNASKGKKVKNELKAIVELAKVDPTIVKRYTTPGSQALQDITAQVDSFSFMPTIQKKKKQPVVDPWAFEDRRGGRR